MKIIKMRSYSLKKDPNVYEVIFVFRAHCSIFMSLSLIRLFRLIRHRIEQFLHVVQRFCIQNRENVESRKQSSCLLCGRPSSTLTRTWLTVFAKFSKPDKAIIMITGPLNCQHELRNEWPKYLGSWYSLWRVSVTFLCYRQGYSTTQLHLPFE